MEKILSAQDVIKGFQKGEVILKGITLEIKKGDFTVILGPSGSGKSTLLSVLSGMIKPDSGQVFYQNSNQNISNASEKELARWRRNEISSIFQDYLLLRNLTVRENIEIGKSPDTDPIPIHQLTEILGIEDIMTKFPSQLSGGQQQRAAIARAVIKRPQILFCDEATGALDESNSKRVVGLLHDLKKKFGITVLFVTHNLQIAETADRIITVKDGRIHQDYRNENPIEADDMVWG